MAKALLACFREKTARDFSGLLKVISSRLTPDNLVANKPYSYCDDSIFMCIYHPTPTVQYEQASLCLGISTDFHKDVFRPRSSRPDGTFALFRVNEQYVEIASDYTASRTIWYFKSEEVFIASTSQRMIILLLSDFLPNHKAFSWMLSSGSLGPGLAWDRRLKSVPPNSTVQLDRMTWNLVLEDRSSLDFNQLAQPPSYHERALKAAIGEAIQGLGIDPSAWVLALSGGMDSRSLLYYLKGDFRLKLITWGLKGSLGKPHSDAAVAKRLAAICNLPHEYAETDLGNESFVTTFNRFLIAGEGRVDHLSGYMDGLKLWSVLSASQRGIIRGYDALGHKPPVTNTYQARRASSLIVTADYRHSVIPKEFELSEKDIPPALARKPGESLAQWRDRLWLEYRTPVVTAALEDIKAAYVEILNPLLCSKIVRVIQALPDELRTHKALFEKIVREMFPGVPFAKRDSIQHIEEILSVASVKKFIRCHLLDSRHLQILPEKFLTFLAESLDKRLTGAPVTRRLKVLSRAYLPNSMWNLLRRQVGHEALNIHRTSLRALIIICMTRLLEEDAQAGRKALQGVVEV